MRYNFIVEYKANSEQNEWAIWTSLNEHSGRFYELETARKEIIKQFVGYTSKVELDKKDEYLYHRTNSLGNRDGCIIRIRYLIPPIDWSIGITDLLLNKMKMSSC